MGTAPRRSDAVENRSRIVAAARDVLAESGESGDPADPSALRLNAVAKRAGVGQGTLYRHFPTREALLAEVYRHDVDELTAAAPALLAEHPPLEALSLWFDRLIDRPGSGNGIVAAVRGGVWQDLVTHGDGPVGDALTLLLDAGKVTGEIRAGVDARHVILLLGCLGPLGPGEWETHARPLVRTVLEGLRSRP